MTKTLRFNHYSSLYSTDKVGLVHERLVERGGQSEENV